MKAPRWAAELGERLLRFAERRLPALTRLAPPAKLPIRLDRRRIYVLPTAFGLFLGVLLAAMSLGALNYNNNPALMLSFLLAGTLTAAQWHGFLSMHGLVAESVSAVPVHAGERARLTLKLASPDGRVRRGLQIDLDGATAFATVPADGHVDVEIPWQTTVRGWHRPGRFRISQRRPLGVFRFWSYVHPASELLVWPRLESPAPPLPEPAGSGTARMSRGPGEELHGLREFRFGDPARLIAWKRTAQLQTTLVREFETPAGGDLMFDWQSVGGLDDEAKIARLARFVNEAERRQLQWTLRLPAAVIGPGTGPALLAQAMRSLAELPV